MTMAQVDMRPMLYVIGFPKSGTHLANLMAGSICQRAVPDHNWFSTFKHHSWSTEWINLDRVDDVFDHLVPGTFLKGHAGYHPRIERALFRNGIGTAFVYRDFRDVAVSQMFHILSTDTERHHHPDRAPYLALPDHEAVLIAVIEGLDQWPGLFERWALYAGWLDVRWVLPLQYEQMRYYQKSAATLFIRYALGSAVLANGDERGYLSEADLEQRALVMVQNMRNTRAAPTFRKGKVGNWRQYFTPAVKACFKAHAGDWLVRLGYEKDNNW